MFNGEPFAGAADKPAGQDVLVPTDNHLLRENAKLKQELAEVKDELKRLIHRGIATEAPPRA